MPTFAAVDIGSNSVRLKVSRLRAGRLQEIHEDREVTRLGEGVFQTGLLLPQNMQKTVAVLRRFQRAIQAEGADRVRVVATSAVRDARNAPAFREWVKTATGWDMEVISGLEEGRLIHLGVTSGTRTRASRLLLMDLGGGSCELTVAVDGHLRTMVSLPLGAVRLTQDFLKHDPPKKKELERLREFVAQAVGRVRRKIVAEKPQVTIATSGTAAALFGMWESHGNDGNFVAAVAVRKMLKQLAQMTAEERRAVAGVGPRRAEIIVAGAAVFAEVMQRCGLQAFRYSPLGLRDGLLAQMAAEYDHSTRSGRQIEAERHDALEAMGKQYAVDARYAAHVRDLAVQLFRVLRSVHQLPDDYADWLYAAAMLCEAGTYINRTGRRRHTAYIVAHSDIFGYSREQRLIIAALTRYLGKSRPRPADGLMAVLPRNAQEQVPRAVAVLRLARALNLGRRNAVRSVRASRSGGRVLLKLQTVRGGAELEMWAVERERGYFREVFGRDLGVQLS